MTREALVRDARRRRRRDRARAGSPRTASIVAQRQPAAHAARRPGTVRRAGRSVAARRRSSPARSAGRARPRRLRVAGRQDDRDGGRHGRPGLLVAADVRATAGRAAGADRRAPPARAASASSRRMPRSRCRSAEASTASCSTRRARASGPPARSGHQVAAAPRRSFAALAAAQLRMLEHGGAVVRPGGALIYATCSSEPEENDEVVEPVPRAAPDFRPAPGCARRCARAVRSRPGYFRTFPFRDGLEAFFAAIVGEN